MFYFCESLKSITIPESVISTGYNVFENCKALETVNFAENSQLQLIYTGMFRNCSSLKSIKIPASLTKIDDWAFVNCKSLETVTFEETSQLETIDRGAFQDCDSLKSIDLPASVNEIVNQSFGWCDTLSSVTFEENSQLKTIGERAFNSCSLESITIPASVTNIAQFAFGWCNSLTSVIFEGDKPIINNNAFISIAPNATGYFYSNANGWSDGESFYNLTMYVNPDSVLTSGDFRYYVTNEDTVTIIGLVDNSTITNLIIPETINEKPVTIIAGLL